MWSILISIWIWVKQISLFMYIIYNLDIIKWKMTTIFQTIILQKHKFICFTFFLCGICSYQKYYIYLVLWFILLLQNVSTQLLSNGMVDYLEYVDCTRLLFFTPAQPPAFRIYEQRQLKHSISYLNHMLKINHVLTDIALRHFTSGRAQDSHFTCQPACLRHPMLKSVLLKKISGLQLRIPHH